MLQFTPVVSCAVLLLLPAKTIAHYCYHLENSLQFQGKFTNMTHVFVLPCLLYAKEVAEAHYVNT
jgi:hypothetical protein